MLLDTFSETLGACKLEDQPALGSGVEVILVQPHTRWSSAHTKHQDQGHGRQRSAPAQSEILSSGLATCDDLRGWMYFVPRHGARHLRRTDAVCTAGASKAALAMTTNLAPLVLQVEFGSILVPRATFSRLPRRTLLSQYRCGADAQMRRYETFITRGFDCKRLL